MTLKPETLYFRGAELIDGTGAPPRRAGVLVGEGKILGFPGAAPPGARTVAAEGRWLVPGFVDVHSHSDFWLLRDGGAEGKILQGVTTEVVGNCGSSAFPLAGERLRRVRDQNPDLDPDFRDLAGYRRALSEGGIAVNLASFTGQGNLRGSVVGYAARPAAAAERRRMLGLLEASFEEGSRGISTGMPYPPGAYTPGDELVEVLAATGRAERLWSTHLASESDRLLESLEASISLAERCGVRLLVSHLKAGGRSNWEKLPRALEAIATARDRGLRVACDRYPYTAGCTDLDILLPAWAWEGGEAAELERLRDPLARRRLAEAVGEKDWDNVVVASAPGPDEDRLRGRSLASLASERGSAPVETLLDLLVERELRVEAYFFGMSEENMDLVLSSPFCFVASDASARPLLPGAGEGAPHPRAFGTFSRFLERYVFSGRLAPQEAIARMTSGPAAWAGLQDRGRLLPGGPADLVLLDPRRFRDRADYDRPRRPPRGIDLVMVNGVTVAQEGKCTGARPGRFLGE
ncbi:MAG TPA: amidohydrolase family protein [bacterium]|nr:amidohydrolase family protein [bacterium]HPQ67305.1 amidohydrolase family protein [bacterium]